MEQITTLDGRALRVPITQDHLAMLAFLVEAAGEDGEGELPSLADLAEAFDVAKSGARYRLERLRINGLVEWPPRKHRQYQPTALGRWAASAVEVG